MDIEDMGEEVHMKDFKVQTEALILINESQMRCDDESN